MPSPLFHNWRIKKMNYEKKLSMQQRCIENLEKEVNRLEQENKFLKQLIPDSDRTEQVRDIYSQLQSTLSETLAMKKQYESSIKAVSKMKQKYKAKMNDLLERLRTDVKKKENFFSQI